MLIETIKPLGGLKGNGLSRQKSINDYYDNPNYCKFCDSIIEVKIGEKICEIRRKKFCNHSCAASYNNKDVIRNGISNFCECGKKIHSKSRRCLECHRNQLLSKTLKEVKSDQYPHWNVVRKHARNVMDKSDFNKTCKFCNHREFDDVVEVAHIKDITLFDESTLISVVNDLNNLIYLCPSHHSLFDRGLLKLS